MSTVTCGPVCAAICSHPVRSLVLLALGVFVLKRLRAWLRTPRVDTAKARAFKRAQQHTAFVAGGVDPTDPQVAGGVPSREEQTILMQTVAELSAAMRSGALKPSAVTRVFALQTVRAHNRFNAVTEVMLEAAVARAKQLDEAVPVVAHAAATGAADERDEKHSAAAAAAADADDPVAGQILFGVPVSLKDSVGVKGTDQTLGLAGSINAHSPADSAIVEALRAAGAVPLVKSNVPQTMLSFECSNPLWGRTAHPTHPRGFTPGGSSGGEAVLCAVRGSACGIGTDIGGSVRIPAHFTGVTALKPTGRRVSQLGFRASVPGQEAVVGVPGPMGSCVEDCVLLCRAMWTKAVFARDADLVPLPFDVKQCDAYSGGDGSGTGARLRPLRIGYYTHDGFVSAAPPCARAVTETKTALEAAGHTVVPWQPPRVVDGVALFYSLLNADNAKTVGGIVAGEQLEPYVKLFLRNTAVPKPVRRLVAALLRWKGDVHASRLFAAATHTHVTGLWQLHKQRKEYRQQFYTAFQDARLDAVICPAHALPAIRNGGYTDITFACSYTLLFNVLDWPAGVVPVTRVTAAEPDAPPPPAGFTPGMLDAKINRAYAALMAPGEGGESGVGLPVGVQVFTPPFTDERCLGVMRVVERTRKLKRSDFLTPAAVGEGFKLPA